MRLRTDIERLMRDILSVYEKVYIEQGHKDTGALIKEAEIKAIVSDKGIAGELLLNYYWIFLEQRLPPDKVPFSPNSGARYSKLIGALQQYFKRKGNSDKESLKAAFATAKVWKKEGRPTNASKRFSNSGKRLGVMTETIKRLDSVLESNLNKIGEKFLIQMEQRIFPEKLD